MSQSVHRGGFQADRIILKDIIFHSLILGLKAVLHNSAYIWRVLVMGPLPVYFDTKGIGSLASVWERGDT